MKWGGAQSVAVVHVSAWLASFLLVLPFCITVRFIDNSLLWPIIFVRKTINLSSVIPLCLCLCTLKLTPNIDSRQTKVRVLKWVFLNLSHIATYYPKFICIFLFILLEISLLNLWHAIQLILFTYAFNFFAYIFSNLFVFLSLFY